MEKSIESIYIESILEGRGDIKRSNIRQRSGLTIPKLNDPIVGDGIDILKNIKSADKFSNKKQFDKVLKAQDYFSASASKTFLSADDLKNRKESENSVILKNTGELVAVWDDSKQIGYIVQNHKFFKQD